MTRFLSISALLSCLAMIAPAFAQDTDPDSVVEISGACSSFGRTVGQTNQDFKACDPTLLFVHVSGRGVFTAHKAIDDKTTLIMTFSGAHALEPLGQPYDLVVDKLAFASAVAEPPTILVATGKCHLGMDASGQRIDAISCRASVPNAGEMFFTFASDGNFKKWK